NAALTTQQPALRTQLLCCRGGTDIRPVSTSQSRAEESATAVITRRPSGLKARCLGEPPRFAGGLSPRVSMTFFSHWPTFLGAPSSAGGSSHGAGARFQTLTVPSSLAVSRRRPSGEKTPRITFTAALCLKGGAAGAPVAASQSRTTPSPPAVATSRPSGL